MNSTTHKLVFIGEPGAGKTTCIAALSDIKPITTDVGCTETDGLCLVAASGKEQGKTKKQSYFLFHSYKSFLKLLCNKHCRKMYFTRKE